MGLFFNTLFMLVAVSAAPQHYSWYFWGAFKLPNVSEKQKQEIKKMKVKKATSVFILYVCLGCLCVCLSPLSYSYSLLR